MHFLCFPIFADIFPILPIKYFLDPRRYFADTDIFNTGLMDCSQMMFNPSDFKSASPRLVFKASLYKIKR